MRYDKRIYDVDEIEKKVKSVLSGDSIRFGNFLEYGSKRTAEKISSQLRERGINCYWQKYDKRYYRIIFTDIKTD